MRDFKFTSAGTAPPTLDVTPKHKVATSTDDDRWVGFRVEAKTQGKRDTDLFGPSRNGNNEYTFQVYEVLETGSSTWKLDAIQQFSTSASASPPISDAGGRGTINVTP
ncbi:hypothetical protein A7982_14020 [Minicystis rosea]|nr:hypothetical protein A7982_14020 [Minicystis rosea]